MKPRKQSAGILLYRRKNKDLELLLVHPGGPFWKNKDVGAWSIPKGEFTGEEDALTAAQREFKEELGVDISGDFIALQPVKLLSGKTVYAWAVEGDLDPASIISNTCEVEWPPRSGKKIIIPEVDRAEWFESTPAKEKINAAQAAFIDELMVYLSSINTKFKI